jgi:hypothetical protein
MRAPVHRNARTRTWREPGLQHPDTTRKPKRWRLAKEKEFKEKE